MAARAFSEIQSGLPARTFTTMLQDSNQLAERPNLLAAAFRNSVARRHGGPILAAELAPMFAAAAPLPKFKLPDDMFPVAKPHQTAVQPFIPPAPPPYVPPVYTAPPPRPISIPSPVEVKPFSAAVVVAPANVATAFPVFKSAVVPAAKPTTVAAPAVIKPVPVQSLEMMDLPLATRVRAVELQRKQQLLVSVANNRLPAGCHVLAWHIIPISLFQGELGRFMMIAGGFHAYGPQNTILLPTMPAGASHLDLPRHPLVVSEAHLDRAKLQLTVLRDRVAAEHRRADTALQNGDASQVFNRTHSKAKYCNDLDDLIYDIAKSQIGSAAIKTHWDHFGDLIATM